MHEASLYQHNCFVTLTYDDKHLPKDGSLDYRDFQLFMKKLRQAVVRENTALGRKGDGQQPAPKFAHQLRTPMGLCPIPRTNIRFYMAGEYGEHYGRPHFHACLFNLDFLDKEPLRKTQAGSQLHRSPTLEKLWTHGYSSIGALTFESAAYAARYILKKITGKQSQKHYEITNTETGEITNRKKEFNNMSRSPGIASRWLEKYLADVYPQGQVVVRGHLSKAPRYYDKQYQKLQPENYDTLQFERDKEAKAHAHDNTTARLATKEVVAKAKAAHLKRNID